MHEDIAFDAKGRAGDMCLAGLNFDTLRPRAEILSDYLGIVTQVYDPDAFFGRVRRVIPLLDPVHLGTAILLRDWWREFDRLLRIMWRVSRHRPEMRRHMVAAARMRPVAPAPGAHRYGDDRFIRLARPV